ncbi:MAG TPA: hypothetical protein ENI58_02830 [Nitrospirae bacterium]|nr:hypothetical protein [Nitrospirota bacterium]
MWRSESILFNRKAIGIEFRDDSVVAVCIKKGVAGIEMVSSVTFAYTGMDTDGEAVSGLKRFITRYRIDEKSVSVSIPKSWGLVRFLDVPAPGDDALERLIQYEIGRHIPFQIEDVYYAFQVAGRKGNKYRVVLVVVHKEKLELIRKFLEKIPLQPDIINISPFCILNAIELSGYKTNIFTELSGFAVRPDVFGNKDTVCVSLFMGEHERELAVIKGGSLIYFENLVIDSDAPAENLCSDFFNKIDIILSRLSLNKADRVLLSGHGASGLSTYAARRPGLEVRVIDSLPGASVDTGNTDMYGLFPSVGAALAGLGLGSIKVNILPDKRKNNKKTGALITKISLALILFLFAGLMISGIIREKRTLEAIEEDVRRNGPELSAVEKLRSELALMEKRRDFLLNVRDNNISKLEILAELTDIIPMDAWLKSLVFKELPGKDDARGELVIAGFSGASSRLISLLENSDFFENVEFVGPVTKGTQGEGFKIRARIVNPDSFPRNMEQ